MSIEKCYQEEYSEVYSKYKKREKMNTFKLIFDCDPHKYDKVINEISNDKDKSVNEKWLEDKSDEYMKTYFKESCIYERSIVKDNVIEEVCTYMKNTKIPIIEELYDIIFTGKNCYRQSTDPYGGFVGVKKGKSIKLDEYYNIGMNASSLNPKIMQELVNEFYEGRFYQNVNQEIVSMLCYLFYERIHPHHDGNGRMGRILFLENTFRNISFPISFILTKLRMPELMQNIFNEINFGGKQKYIGDIPKSREDKEYYTLHVTDSLLKNIVKCLCIAKEYKILRSRGMDHKDVCKILRKKGLFGLKYIE